MPPLCLEYITDTSGLRGQFYVRRALLLCRRGAHWRRTIGTNRPDGYAIVDLIAEDIADGAGRDGRPGLDSLLERRGVQVVKYSDWKKIEEAEAARARDGSPREKFVSIAEMIAARG